LGEWGYSSTLSLPWHQMKVNGQLYAPATSPPGKQPLGPIGQEAGWPQSCSTCSKFYSYIDKIWDYHYGFSRNI